MKTVSVINSFTNSKVLMLLMVALLTTPCMAQTDQEIIRTIRRDFQSINSDTSLKMISMDAEEFLDGSTDGGGELKASYKNGQLVKLVEWIGISYGNRIREFYFKEGKLFFVYDRFEAFVVKGDELDRSKTKTSYEGRFYISDGKMVGRKQTGIVPDGADEVKEFEAIVKEYRARLDKKK